jgi:transcriptional regulator with XRE-family HTH domain
VNHHLSKKFGRFVESFGVAELAQRLDVDASAVYHWTRGVSLPRPEHARQLQLLASERGVKLSLDEIYFRDEKGLAKCREFRERRKMRAATSAEKSGKERFDSFDAGLDFARQHQPVALEPRQIVVLTTKSRNAIPVQKPPRSRELLRGTRETPCTPVPVLPGS